MSELIRPNIEDNGSLSYEERLEAINRYMGEASIALNNTSTEFNWAICQRIILRRQQRESENE